MNAKLAWGMTMVVFLPFLTGCMQNPGVVRGQTPAGYVPNPAGPNQTVSQAGFWGNPSEQTCPTCGISHHPGYHLRRGPLQAPLQHVLSHGNNQPGAGRGHHPTHYHWFSYEQPGNLVYPPANQPAAVVQYPYYTLKGPDDFFLK